MTRPLTPGQAAAAAAVLLLLAANVPVTFAQSLGDVARHEAERRKQAPSGRVYTNDDLAPADPDPAQTADAAAAPNGAAVAKTSGAASSARDDPSGFVLEEDPQTGLTNLRTTTKPREKRDEQYWRTLAGDLRSRVAKVTAELAAQEARLAELDAGPETPTTVREREVISATVARLQSDARSHTEELTRFMTRAQLAKVPDAWFR